MALREGKRLSMCRKDSRRKYELVASHFTRSLRGRGRKGSCSDPLVSSDSSTSTRHCREHALLSCLYRFGRPMETDESDWK